MPQTKAHLPPREVRGLDPSSSPFSTRHWPLSSRSLPGTVLLTNT